MRKSFLVASLTAMASFTAHPALGDLSFNLTPASGMDSRAVAGFQMAANRWSSLLSDNIRVNINIGFQSLSAGVLGQAYSTETTYNYLNVKTALGSHRATADDNTA